MLSDFNIRNRADLPLEFKMKTKSNDHSDLGTTINLVKADERIIIDVSHYVHFMTRSKHVSGIQRFIQAMIRDCQSDNHVVFSVRSKRRFWKFINNQDCTAEQSIKNYIDQKKAIHTLRQHNIKLLSRLQALPQIIDGLLRPNLQDLSFNRNDTFLVLDAAWNKQGYLQDVAELKKQFGTRICVFLHDAIPLFGEDFVSLSSYRNFHSYLEWVDQWADVMYCNSNYSKQDLIRSGLLQKANEAIVIPLAHEFISSVDTTKTNHHDIVRNRINARMKEVGASHFALCVGTIEARKNQKLLIDAWAQLRDERQLPLLVLAGKMGHHSEAFQIVLERDRPAVLILEDSDDQTLEYLYRNCSFTIFPSLFEGWGLPVGESLWFGKPCLASQASSIPEAGGEWIQYFDPRSLDDLKSALRQFLDHKAKSSMPRHIELRCWHDVTIDFLTQLRSGSSDNVLTKARS